MKAERLILLVIGTIFLFSGCVTSPKLVTGPDGTPHELITCSAVESCYEEAAKICGKYKIVNTSTNTTGFKGTVNSSIQLLVKCEK